MHKLYSSYSKCHIGLHGIPHDPKLSIPELYNFRLTTYNCPLEQGLCDAESEYYNQRLTNPATALYSNILSWDTSGGENLRGMYSCNVYMDWVTADNSRSGRERK